MTRIFYLSLAPWLVFAVADRSAGVGPAEAGMLATGIAAAVAVLEFRSRRPRPLALVAVTLFSSMALLSTAGDAVLAGRYDRAIALTVLAATFALSIPFTPLALAYCRESVSPRRAADPTFRRQSSRLSVWWSLAMLAAGGSLAVGAVTGGPLAATVCNWLVPILSICIAAVLSSDFLAATADGAESVPAVLTELQSPRPHQPHGPARLHLAGGFQRAESPRPPVDR